MGITEIVVSAINGGVKMVSSITSFLGKIYEPRHIRKKGDAEAYRIDKICETLRKNSDVTAKFDDGALYASLPEDYSEFVKRTKYRTACQELQKQQNLEQVLDNAYEQLEVKDVPDTQMDKDWLTHFINCAEEVSNEDMQKLWGKILAGEVETPGSFSKRTLNTILNMSQAEAKVFQFISQFVLCTGDNRFVINNKTIWEKYGILYDNILTLGECGVLTDGLISQHSKLNVNTTDIIYTQNMFGEFYSKSIGEIDLEYSVLPLTSAGKELYKLVHSEPNDSYLLDVLKNIYDSRKDTISVKIFKVISIFKDKLEYDEKPLDIWQ